MFANKSIWVAFNDSHNLRVKAPCNWEIHFNKDSLKMLIIKSPSNHQASTNFDRFSRSKTSVMSPSIKILPALFNKIHSKFSYYFQGRSNKNRLQKLYACYNTHSYFPVCVLYFDGYNSVVLMKYSEVVKLNEH